MDGKRGADGEADGELRVEAEGAGDADDIAREEESRMRMG